MRIESGCFLWVIQQYKVVRCCPEVQALTVRGCSAVAPIEVLAVEAANTQTEIWERRNGRRCESRAWRFVDVNDLVSCGVYAQPLSLCSGDWWPVTILTAREQTWQGRASSSWLAQLVRSWESLACLQLCSGSPVGRWWMPCSYRLASCSITLILFAVNFVVHCFVTAVLWSILHLSCSSEAVMRLNYQILLKSPLP